MRPDGVSLESAGFSGPSGTPCPARIRDVVSEYKPARWVLFSEQDVAAAMLRPAIELPAPARAVMRSGDVRKSAAKSDRGDAELRHWWRMFYSRCRIALLGADSTVAAGDDLSLPPSALCEHATPCAEREINVCRQQRRASDRIPRPKAFGRKSLKMLESPQIGQRDAFLRHPSPFRAPDGLFPDDQPDLRH